MLIALHPRHGLVAQGIEQQPSKLLVGGSNPPEVTIRTAAYAVPAAHDGRRLLERLALGRAQDCCYMATSIRHAIEYCGVCRCSSSVGRNCLHPCRCGERKVSRFT